jgi:ubiquinone/menaquinone biosynthesis C-methylase UbiE
LPKYDPEIITRHFDNIEHDEWSRLDKTPIGKAQFHIHNYYLHKYIKKGDRVLEIGPGPGRFTIELAKLGSRIAIVDISELQLKLNKERVEEAGFEDSVEWRKKRDILNLEGIDDGSFDCVVCYGGPLSYVLEFVHNALKEIIRVTKKGGIILSSLMSTLGTYHHLINDVFNDEVGIELERFDELTRTGDIIGDLAAHGTHQCKMYRWSEFQEVLARHPVEILDASSANFLSNGLVNEEYLTGLMKDRKKWNMFLKWELDFCREPGAIDSGTHFIVTLKKK